MIQSSPGLGQGSVQVLRRHRPGDQGRWTGIGYVYREGRPGRFRYRLAGKGRRWKRKADAELPRAKELVEEIVAHQRAMGWIPASEPEPTPEPRRSTERPQQWPPPVERRVPEPPPEVRRDTVGD
jgi:hypothetical protein